MTRFCSSSFLFSILTLSIIGCKYDQFEPTVDCGTQGPVIQLLSKEDATCNNADGSVSVSASGGNEGYQFSINDGPGQESGDFTGLSAGTYVLAVRDGNGCTNTLQVAIANVDGVVISSVETALSGCNSTNGSISITGSSGALPYSYQIDQGAPQANNNFTNLAAGLYSIRIIDDLGCDYSEEVQVLSGVSFANTISSIITANCTLPTCHGGNQSPDFRELSNIQANADMIKTRTGNGSMPPAGGLSQNEVDLIACWVDDGALNN